MTDKPDRYAALVWRITDPSPDRLEFETPLAVLTEAVERLKDGYQVRLTDRTVEWFRALPQPDPEFRAAALADGQAAALVGPPDHSGMR